MEPNKEANKPRISYRYYELPEGELVPVSYTHLDVYKRQTYNIVHCYIKHIENTGQHINSCVCHGIRHNRFRRAQHSQNWFKENHRK